MATLKPLEPANLASLIGITYTGSPEQDSLLGSIAQVALESCLLRFVAEYSEPEQVELDTWLSAHHEDPDLTAELLQKFPRFAALLSDELEVLASTATSAKQLLLHTNDNAPAFA